MKKTLIVIACILVALWISVRIFAAYNATHLLSNQAVFNVYLDISPDEVDEYFGLEEGTFDPQAHLVICQLPVYNVGFKPQSKGLNFNVQEINCNQEFNSELHAKYDNSELKGTQFKLMVIRNAGLPVALFDAEMAINQGKIIASKEISFNYKRGKINNIVFSGNTAADYCTP